MSGAGVRRGKAAGCTSGELALLRRVLEARAAVPDGDVVDVEAVEVVDA